VQGWDRYAYAGNNPLRYTDPSGHRNCEEDGYNCPGDQKFPTYNWYTWWAQRFAKKSGGYTSTYALAGIGVQNPVWPRASWWKRDGEYSGEGIAKITDKEMETPYGERIYKGDDYRGHGLGMLGQDQNDPEVAVEAMKLRIQLRTEVCDGKCTSTDIFLAAALGQNGPGFNPDNMDDLVNGKVYKPRLDGSHSLQWEEFLTNITDPDKEQFNRDMIGQFASNVLYLQDQGWDVPNDIDWGYVYTLTITTVQP